MPYWHIFLPVPPPLSYFLPPFTMTIIFILLRNFSLLHYAFFCLAFNFLWQILSSQLRFASLSSTTSSCPAKLPTATWSLLSREESRRCQWPSESLRKGAKISEHPLDTASGSSLSYRDPTVPVSFLLLQWWSIFIPFL